jgi:hypothetical protein
MLRYVMDIQPFRNPLRFGVYSALRNGLFDRLGDARPRIICATAARCSALRGHATLTGIAGRRTVRPARYRIRQQLPASRNRCRSNGNPARPYMLRFTSFNRVTCPSTCPLLHAEVTAASTAA